MRFAVSLCICVLVYQFGLSADFYVSTQGSDSDTGTIAQPFASLERARDAVRELKKVDGKRDIIVQIRGGNYILNQTVVFGVEDSGIDGFKVVYEAYPNEKPVFCSDHKIVGWQRLSESVPFLPKQAAGQVWVADKKREFYTLYGSDGQRLPRARSRGFSPIMPLDSQSVSNNSRTKLHFPKNKLRNWPNLEDIELLVRPNHAWILNILPIESVNPKSQIAVTEVQATYVMDRLHFLKDTRSVWIENAIDYLDKPGEWVLDTKKNKLYLWPRNSEAPKGLVVPSLTEYIRVEGQINAEGPTDVPVRNLVLRGLTFTRGESDRMKSQDKGLQHDWEFQDKANALVRFRGAEGCIVEQCCFTESGAVALRFDLHAQKNRVESNHFNRLGGTGLLICGYGPGTKDVSKNNRVVNNHIHNVGEIYSHAPGIFLWQTGNNRVANNLIHHTPYSGIIISGVMNKFFATKANKRELARTIRWKEISTKPKTYQRIQRFLHSHDNVIEYNEIHHAMEKLGDGNGIYIRGAGPNNIIRRNYIHHLVSPTALQSAIRTDGGQRDTLITENVIYKCVSQGIQIKLNNRAINNYIVDLIGSVHNGEQRPPAYFKLREGPMTGAVIQRNILYHSDDTPANLYDEGRTPRLVAAWANQADTNNNLYYIASDSKQTKAWLKRARRDGIDRASRVGDPLFVDPTSQDFRFKAGSMAAELGIMPIDLSKVGLFEGVRASCNKKH